MLRALQLEPSHQRILVWVGLHSHEFVTVIANAAEEHYCSALSSGNGLPRSLLPALALADIKEPEKQNDIRLKLSDSQFRPIISIALSRALDINRYLWMLSTIFASQAGTFTL